MNFNFVNRFDELLKRFSFNKKNIVLTFKGNVFIDKRNNINYILQDFKKLGIRLMLEDFGQGYSSLEWIYSFPIDIVKIDATMIHDFEKSDSSIAMIMAINDVSHKNGNLVFADGVENSTQIKILKEMGCDYAKGNNLSGINTIN